MLRVRDVDDATRAVIADAGYADYFVHRTGHSIGTAVHGNGTNLDNFETQDNRILLPSTCCSMEPGIYLPEFGIRSEVNLLVHERRCRGNRYTSPGRDCGTDVKIFYNPYLVMLVYDGEIYIVDKAH